MARTLSTKRLAVVQRYSKRLKALQQKGFDIEPLKAEIEKIHGVKITKKGISISEAVYKKEGESIRKGLEGIVKITKEHAKVVKKREKAKKYGEAVKKRTEKLSKSFGIAKEDFLERVAEVEGVLVTKEGDVIIDPELLDSDMRKAITEKLGSERSLLAEAKEALMSEDGLSEADVELLGKEGLRKKLVHMRVFEGDNSVFKKYYDIFETKAEGAGAKNKEAYGEDPGSYLKASKAMSELGHIVREEGFGTSYVDKKRQVMEMLKNLK